MLPVVYNEKNGKGRQFSHGFSEFNQNESGYLHLGYNLRIKYELRHEKTNILRMRKQDTDQLRGNREADQRLCFRYIDSTIPLLSKSVITSLWPSFVAVQPGLYQTRSETRTLVFS